MRPSRSRTVFSARSRTMTSRSARGLLDQFLERGRCMFQESTQEDRMRSRQVVAPPRRHVLGLVAVVALGGLAGAAFAAPPAQHARRPTAPAAGLDGLAAARVIDLTHPFDAHTVYWPNAPSGFQLEQLHFGPSDAGFFYAAYRFCAPEHGGTHLDAPIHFSKDGQA